MRDRAFAPPYPDGSLRCRLKASLQARLKKRGRKGLEFVHPAEEWESGGERGWHARLLDPDGNVVYFDSASRSARNGKSDQAGHARVNAHRCGTHRRQAQAPVRRSSSTRDSVIPTPSNNSSVSAPAAGGVRGGSGWVRLNRGLGAGSI